jgi:pimeloyl-ACP methyl ester carboxylesterase
MLLPPDPCARSELVIISTSSTSPLSQRRFKKTRPSILLNASARPGAMKTAAEGWRCVAPDMRGYGGSSAPTDSQAYTLNEIVGDMVELHDHLGARPAIWVGHDWGSPVAGALAAHHGVRSRGVVLISVPYFPEGFALPSLLPLIDRRLYPEGGRLCQPVLFINGDWDPICDIYCSRLGESMRPACQDLSVTNLPAGHWVPLERKTELVQAIRSWLKTKDL